MANRQIGWSQESNLLWQIGNQIDRFEKVIFTSLSNTVPSSRTLTINGVTYDLSADRSWTIAAGITGSGASGQVAYWNGTGSVTGSTGLVYNDTTGLITLSKNQNAQTLLSVSNTTSGTSSNAALSLISDISSGSFNAFKTSTTYTTYKILVAKDAGFYNGTQGGDFSFLNDNTAGKFKIAVGGSSTAQLTLTAAGRLLLGTTTESVYIVDAIGKGAFEASVSSNSVITDGVLRLTNTNIANKTTAFPVLYLRRSGQTGVSYENSASFDLSAYQNNITSSFSQLDIKIAEGNTFIPDVSIMSLRAIGVGINNTTPHASSMLDIVSTTKGFLPPRMTNAQRTAISSPAVGLIVYCTDSTEGLYQYINNAWVNLTGIVTNRQAASYTLALGDSNDLVEMNVATANNLTVPLNSSVAFPIGTKIDISQYGAGQTTVVATGGVTVRSAGGALKLALQYSGASLVKIGTDEWYLFGDITV